jgi:hypothetical protein
MSGKGKGKRLDEASQEALQSELTGSMFFQQATTPQVDETASIQTDETTSTLVDKTIKPQTDKATSGQMDKPAKPQVEKYTTHLRPATIKAVKRYAFEHDRKDYEIVQQAIDEFLERHKDE